MTFNINWNQRILLNENVDIGYNEIIKFLKKAEDLYGKCIISPNMHYHLHLKECYGFFHTLWCYPYERLNGV